MGEAELGDAIAIEPLARPPRGVVQVPGSKSITNRALLLAALAQGTSQLTGALFSEDTEYFYEALAELGIQVRADAAASRFTVEGTGGRIPAREGQLFVGLAGTAARFLTAYCALGNGTYTIDGVARMRERPLEPLLAALRQLGAGAVSVAGTGCPPVTIHATGLDGGTARLDASQSSQFLSALLLVAPYARRPVTIQLEGELPSRPYVAVTVAMMKSFGGRVAEDRRGSSFRVDNGARYRGRSYAVEPDASAASYFFAAAAATGGRIRVKGLGAGALQGDVHFVDVLAAMGCRVKKAADFIEVEGPADGLLAGVDVDLNAMSDMVLTLAPLAPFARGPITIRNVANVRVKETDRLAAASRELRRLGLQVEEWESGMRVHPGPVGSGVVATYGDHRMAMGFAVLGLRVPGIRIADPGCVAKTFPDYFARLVDLRSLG